MNKILIIEDDIALRNELQTLLERNGYETAVVDDFANGCQQMLNQCADLILLDINLPGVDGQNLLREFRKSSNTPVIMVTSQNTEMDEVLCMSYGADDFIAKPYHPSILLLHIEAIFRRMNRGNQKLAYGKLVVDTDRGVIVVDGVETELSKNEMKILVYLMKHQGQIVSRDALMDYLWDTDSFVDDNTLTVNINRVRKKLEENGMTDVIKTKRGQGYILG